MNSLLNKLIEECRPYTNQGHVATYIPELANADADAIGICIVQDGEVIGFAGEDFGMFLEKVPGVMALVGVGNEACGAIWPQHSSKYTVDEDALLNSVMLYAQVALDFNAQ